MAICGPKCSLCWMILGIWGAVQLGLMGVFFFIHSVAFAEDITAEYDEKKGIEAFYEDLDTAYKQGAINCWIAASMYCLVTLVAAHQFRANRSA